MAKMMATSFLIYIWRMNNYSITETLSTNMPDILFILLHLILLGVYEVRITYGEAVKTNQHDNDTTY